MALINLPPGFDEPSMDIDQNLCCSLDTNERWALINYVLALILKKVSNVDYTDCDTLVADLAPYRDISVPQAQMYTLLGIISSAEALGVSFPDTFQELRNDAECYRLFPEKTNEFLPGYLWTLIVGNMTP